MQLKEQVLETRERNLTLQTDIFEYNRKQTARISMRQLQLWKQEAKALGRKLGHLAQIDQVMAAASEVAGDLVEIPLEDYRYMLLDQKEFSRRAFELIEKRHQLE